VLCTTCEALRNGLKVTVLTDAVAGVDIVPGESVCAIEEMVKAGAQLATVEELQAVPGLELPEGG
jgi:nicotinamidase-related amidase